MYTDKVTDRSIACAVILFKMSLDIINPQIVIDRRSKEKKLEDLTIEAFQNNFCTYLTTMQ